MKTLLLLLSKSPNARKFCLFLCFLSFFHYFCFLFLANWATTENFQGLSHSNVSKNTNQVTQVTNIGIISFERKVTWFATAGIPSSCLFSVVYILLTKEGGPFLINQRQWHLRNDILKYKIFDVKKLIPKISDFTIVIFWPLQMFGLKGSRYALNSRVQNK